MAIAIEEKLESCEVCSRPTKHSRNTQKSSGFMLFVHLVLTVVTVGIWFVLIILWKIGSNSISPTPWTCNECGNEKTDKSGVMLRVCLVALIIIMMILFTSNPLTDNFLAPLLFK